MRALLFSVAVSLLASTAVAQDVSAGFRTRLTTAAFVPADGPNAGDGWATAQVIGRKIKIEGRVTDLASPATRVTVHTGLDVGVPGDALVAELPLSAGGAFAGELPANAANTALLRSQRLYVQVETQAVPDGALWGWLMPNHPFPGQNTPEKANPYAR